MRAYSARFISSSESTNTNFYSGIRGETLPKIERWWANADLNKRVDWRFRNHCFARDGDRWHPYGRCFDTPMNDENHRPARHRDRRQANKKLLGKRRRNAKHAR